MTPNQKWQRGIFANSPEGFKALLQWLTDNKTGKCHAVMETTGRYSENLAYLLYIADHYVNVSVVNPAQIKYYGRSLLKQTKSTVNLLLNLLKGTSSLCGNLSPLLSNH